MEEKEMDFDVLDEFQIKQLVHNHLREIYYRILWVDECYKEIKSELNKIEKNTSGYDILRNKPTKNVLATDITHVVFRKVNELLLHANVIGRILDASNARKLEKKFAKNRVKMIRNAYPDLTGVKPPKSLKILRDHYEHLDAKIDKWSYEKGSFFNDMAIIESDFLNLEERDNFRVLNNNCLIFWNIKLNIDDLMDWVEKIREVIKDYDLNLKP